jgi:hypothetical protein
VYLFGACVTSWKQVSGDEVLYVRPDAVFDKSKPISGGIPHCFPQFGPGKIQQVRRAARCGACVVPVCMHMPWVRHTGHAGSSQPGLVHSTAQRGPAAPRRSVHTAQPCQVCAKPCTLSPDPP